MNVGVSLENEPRGYANLDSNGKNMTVFLANVVELLPYLGSEFLPFESIEELFEEWVIHELIHKFTMITTGEKLVDGWHIVLCHSFGSDKNCSCPVDCFWREVYSKEELK